MRKSRLDFENCIKNCIKTFNSNQVCKAIDEGYFEIRHYHKLLKTIFYQTYENPTFLALAGVMLDKRQFKVRDYLIEHAHEEALHWQWTINDLEKTGYNGPSPHDEYPVPETAAYIAFNFYCASRMPITRLSIALMLESIGANHGKNYAEKTCKLLKLRPDQATFFFGHGDTDVKHTAEIWEAIDKLNLSEEQWGQMIFAAETGLDLYMKMYNQVMEE